MARIRITRTLVYEGEEFWVRASTSPFKTLVSQDKPFIAGAGVGTITETSRIEQTLPETEEKSNG